MQRGEASASGPTVGFAPEQHDVRLGPVDGVVHPAARLLHANAAPFSLRRNMQAKPLVVCPRAPVCLSSRGSAISPRSAACPWAGAAQSQAAGRRAWRERGEGTVSGLRVRFKGQLQRFRALPVLENVVIILLRVLNVVVRHGEHTRLLLEDARRCCYPQALFAADQRPARLRVMGT